VIPEILHIPTALPASASDPLLSSPDIPSQQISIERTALISYFSGGRNRLIIGIEETLEITKTHYAASRSEWRKWLQKHHSTEKEIWLVYYKKHTGMPRVGYNDAVEEALCFGWIDSLVKRIDAETYAQKFTPRKPKSKWSELNKRRIKKLVKEGLMTNAGLSKIDKSLLTEKDTGTPRLSAKTVTIPNRLKKDLRKSVKAWANFNNLAPSYQRLYIRWITSVKKEETYQRRLTEAIGLLEQNKKLGMK
jgi:uncharacterized protein YdeI (YjbR/CyaY-like superfamily)